MTDKIIQTAKNWQERPLESIYPIVFMDGIVVKDIIHEVESFYLRSIFAISGKLTGEYSFLSSLLTI